MIAIRQVPKFQRQNQVRQHECRTQSGAQTEKEHPATAIAAERLKRCVIEDSNGLSKSFLEVKANPALSQMLRIGQDSTIAHRRRKSDSDHIGFPSLQLSF